jgi:hypothetical protein
MPWPDFTELTFGYAFLREFEHDYVDGGTFPKAPDFISQYDEATEGHDVKIAISDATPIFIQFKRSYVLTTKRAKEIAAGHYYDPRIYRMHLHKRGAYRQHRALQRRETAGDVVFYVTSQIYTGPEFAEHFANGTIVNSASALFSPNEIDLPNEHQDHHVSFKAEDPFGYVFSPVGRQFKRKLANADTWIPHVRDRRRSLEQNRKALADFVGEMRQSVRPRSPLIRLIVDRPVEQQASILAYFLLDAHLTFAKKL